VLQFVNAASELIERLHKLDVEGTVENLNRMMVTFADRADAFDTAGLSRRLDRPLAKAEMALAGFETQKDTGEGLARRAG